MRLLLETTSDVVARLRSRVLAAPTSFPAVELASLHGLLDHSLHDLWPLLCSEDAATQLHKGSAGNERLIAVTEPLLHRHAATIDQLVALEHQFGELTELFHLPTWPLDDATESDDDLGRVQR